MAYYHINHDVYKKYVNKKRKWSEMAQVLHSKDGRPIDETNALPVQIAGADATGGAVNTTTNDILPFDHQATLTNTAVTHTSAIVAPSGVNTQSAWQPVLEGMTEYIANFVADGAHISTSVNVFWSEDGTNTSGKHTAVVSNAISASHKSSTQWFPVAGNFYKAELFSGDTVPRTCSANIKFRP
jgi:hypothetical protein